MLLRNKHHHHHTRDGPIKHKKHVYIPFGIINKGKDRRMVRNYIRKTTGPSYSKQDLENAVVDVQNKNLSFRAAAEQYHVPIAVISQRLHGRFTPIDTNPGRKTVFNQETENKIVQCLLARANSGYPCDKDELLNLIQEYVTSQNISTPFTNNRPGNDWYYAFMKRHANLLSLKKPEHLQKCRKDARRPYVIYSFYEDLQNTLERFQLNTEDKACFIYNADESGFKSDPNRLKAIGQKGKPLVRVSGGSGRESTTVLACIGADGSFLPPLIVFKGAGIQARWTSDKAYPGTVYSVSKNGWMEEPQFYTWFTQGFIPHINRIRERKSLPNQETVLIYDGHSSHISVRIIEAAISNHITPIKLPSHLTDLLQPLDKCVFGPVKTFWEKELIAFGKKQVGKGTGRLSKSEFVEMLGKAWTYAMKPANIVSGFKSCGLFPVNKEKFPTSAFKDSELQEYLQKKQLTSSNTRGTPLTTNSTIPTNQAEVNITTSADGELASQEPTLLSINKTPALERNNPIITPSTSKVVSISEILAPQYDTKQKDGKCAHRPSETCTSTCLKENIPEENLSKKITEGSLQEPINNSHQDSTLKKLFFLSPEQKENITTIQQANPEAKKLVVPRLKALTYGEILTNEEVLNRLKAAQEKKSQKLQTTLKLNKGTVKRKQNNSKKNNSRNKKKRLNKHKNSDEEDSEQSLCLSDSSDFSLEEQEMLEDDFIDIKTTPLSDLKNGCFALVRFKGGKRNTSIFKYVCSVGNIIDYEVEVTGLKSIDETKQNFALNINDISFVTNEQILGVLPFPEIKMKGERIYYHFAKKVPVLEGT